MERKGLCATCVQSATCIFPKEPPVWQCEEFSNGNRMPLRGRQAKVKRVVYEQVTESE
jgi:hypothetical protein